jgi:hypothetical protein
MKRFSLLLSPDPGAGAPPDPTLGANDAGDSPAAPPAAAAVLASDANEADAGELVKTKRQLADERAARKAEQIRLSELEDENRQLKQVGLTPAPAPAPKAKSWAEDWGTVIDG